MTTFGFNVTTLSENVVFDSNMIMNVTRTLNYLDVVPTPLRLSSLYYKIYVLALNSLFASLIPFASLIYMNFCTVIGKYFYKSAQKTYMPCTYLFCSFTQNEKTIYANQRDGKYFTEKREVGTKGFRILFTFSNL